MDVRWNQNWGLAKIVLCGVILSAGLEGCAKPTVMRPESPKAKAGTVRFTVLAPGAKQVFLVGSFNGWAKDATPMAIINGDSLWAVDIPLKEGEYTFMYLIDGMRWVTPALAEDFVTDEFGQTNGVVTVR